MKTLTVEELINQLLKLPPSAPVWIGVDAGEGFVPCTGARISTGKDEPLDLDEADGEHEYISIEKYVPREGDKVDERQLFDTELSVWRRIAIIE